MSEFITTLEVQAIKDDAINAISTAGSSVIFENAGSEDYIDGEIVTSAPTQINTKAVISTYETEELSNMILANDLKLMINESDLLQIDYDTKVIIDGIAHAIKYIQPIKVKDILVYADIQVRK